MIADIPDYTQRIQAGKKVEFAVLNALRAMGHQIEPPTPEQDKVEKIDGFWIGSKGGRFPLQLKVRESGDDIIFEVIKDIDKNIDGRDLKSMAYVYIVSDTRGRARMYLTEPIKKKAEELKTMALRDLANDPFKTKWFGEGWEMRMQIDRAHGQRKLVAYFQPEMFEALKIWRLNLASAAPSLTAPRS